MLSGIMRARDWDAGRAVTLGPELCCPVVSCEVLCTMGNSCIGPNRLPRWNCIVRADSSLLWMTWLAPCQAVRICTAVLHGFKPTSATLYCK